MRAPDALHRADADPCEPGHGLNRPVGRLARWVLQRQGHHPLGDFRPERGDARGTSLVPQQAVHAFQHKPLLPAPDRRLADPRRAHDLGRADAVGRRQHDPGAPYVLLGAVPVSQDRAETAAIEGAHVNADSCSHPVDSHCRKPAGIPLGTQVSDFDH